MSDQNNGIAVKVNSDLKKNSGVNIIWININGLGTHHNMIFKIDNANYKNSICLGFIYFLLSVSSRLKRVLILSNFVRKKRKGC